MELRNQGFSVRTRRGDVHPTTLLLAIAAWVWSVYWTPTLSGCVGALIVAAIVQILVAPARPRRLTRWIRSLLLVSLVIVVYATVSAVFATGAGVVLWRGPHIPGLGTLQMTTVSLAAGLQRACRIWALLLGVAALAARIRPDDVTVWLGRTFSRAGLTLSMIMTFLPMVQRERQRLTEYVFARADLGPHRAWLDRVRASAVVVQAILANALERSWTLAESMYVRGYTASGRTLYRRPRWVRSDTGYVVALFTAVGLAVTGTLLNHAGHAALATPFRVTVSGWIWVTICGLGVQLRGHRAD